MKLDWTVRVVLALSAVAWAGWMLHLGTVDSQGVVGLTDVWSERVQHLVAVAVFGVLVMMAVGSRPLLIFVLIVLAGLVGETVQLATADRTFSWFDVLADAIGAAAGIVLGVLAGGSKRFAFGAIATALALAVATPWVLEDSPPERARGGEECSDAPPPWPGEPTVVLAPDFYGTPLPTSISESLATRLVQAVSRTNEFTLEAWLEPSDVDQDASTRIFQIINPAAQNPVNLRLRTQGDDLGVRLRTSCQSSRWVTISDVLEAGVPVHVVVTWSSGELATFVDAVEVGRVELPWGDLDAWNPSLGGVTGDQAGNARVFVGAVSSVTMWDAALGPDEIAQRRRLGP